MCIFCFSPPSTSIFDMATSFIDCSGQHFSANAIVSKAGEGDFTTLTDAVNAIPSSAEGGYVIYVKQGIYNENVTVSRSEVTLVGDGKGKTIIRSMLNYQDGVSIEDSGAVIVLADNCIVRHITFENASGKEKGQAVALRSEGDKSSFFLCEFLGYQDTLYVNGGRQFFRECDIYGTVDFIFGDAAMLLQKCNIYFRDFGFMTAQGRIYNTENTAISVDRCHIKASAEFPKESRKGFLGRPWKDFARVIVMKARIDDVIDPAGYEDWDGRSRTAEYIEYDNFGPGSNVDGRVRWPGFKALKADEGGEVKPFSVGVFIDGNEWLPSTGVPFDADV